MAKSLIETRVQTERNEKKRSKIIDTPSKKIQKTHTKKKTNRK